MGPQQEEPNPFAALPLDQIGQTDGAFGAAHLPGNRVGGLPAR
jgi:hypothetical protein